MTDERRPGATSPEGLAFTSYLRIVAIAAVVLIHVLPAIVGNDAIRGSRTWWLATILDIGATWAVPAFVMVSGALILRPSTESTGAFYRRRLVRIGIPLVVAHLLYLAIRVFGRGDVLTADAAIGEVLQARTFTHLYFFWIVLGLYAITPILRPFVAASSQRTIALAGIGFLTWMVAVSVASELLRQLGLSSVPWQPAALTFFLPYIGYFMLGYAIRDRVLGPGALALAAVGFVTGMGLVIIEYAVDGASPGLALGFGGHYQGLPVAIATPCLYLVGRTVMDRAGILSRPEWSRTARWLGELTLGVYVLHFAILIAVRRYVPALSFSETKDSLPLALVEWLLVVVLSFAAAAAIARVPVLRKAIGL